MSKEKKIVGTVISSSWIFTANKDDQLLKNHSIVIDDGMIVDIIDSDSVFDVYNAKEVYQLTDQLLIPGLINAHSHLAMSLLKGYADDVKLSVWLNDHIWPAEKSFVSPLADQAWISYNFYLMDSIQKGDTIFYRLEFFPRRKHDLTFKGFMYVDNKTFGVSKIHLEMAEKANVNFLKW